MRWGAVAWRRRDGERVPVSVNARFERLPSKDLADLAETCLGQAGRELTHSRYTGRDLGQEQFHLERSLLAATQAQQAIQVLLSRVNPAAG